MAKAFVSKGPLKVRAVFKGLYDGKIRFPGDVFVLVDQKDARNGKVLQHAQAVHDEGGNQIHRGAFAEVGTPGGWMERFEEVEAELPEVTTAREMADAQRKSDEEAARIAGMSEEEKVAAAHGADVVPTTKRGLPTAAPQGGTGDVL